MSLGFNNSGGGGQPTHDVRIRPADSTINNIGFRLQPGIILSAQMQTNIVCFTDASQQIAYRVTHGNNTTDIGLLGYLDQL